MRPIEPRFMFRGSAVGLAGHVRRPDELIIPSQASAVVPSTGGYATGTAKGKLFGKVLRFRTSDTSVAADYEDLAKAREYTNGNHAQNRLPTKTTVNVELTGLEVVNKDPAAKPKHTLTCESMAAQMISQSPQTGAQPSIKPLIVSMKGLALDDYALDVRFNKIYTEKDTKQKLVDAFETEGDPFFDQFGETVLAPPVTASASRSRKPAKGRRIPQAGGYIAATVVQSIKWVKKPNPDATIEGNRIFLKGFGYIYIGELLISEFSRRLTMMRLQLGSPIGAEVGCAELESNGHMYPP